MTKSYNKLQNDAFILCLPQYDYYLTLLDFILLLAKFPPIIPQKSLAFEPVLYTWGCRLSPPRTPHYSTESYFKTFHLPQTKSHNISSQPPFQGHPVPGAHLLLSLWILLFGVEAENQWFVSSFLHLLYCFQGPSMLQHVAHVGTSFLFYGKYSNFMQQSAKDLKLQLNIGKASQDKN